MKTIEPNSMQGSQLGGESLRSAANSKTSNPYLSKKMANGLKSRSRFDDDYKRLQKDSNQYTEVRTSKKDLGSPKKEPKLMHQ